MLRKGQVELDGRARRCGVLALHLLLNTDNELLLSGEPQQRARRAQVGLLLANAFPDAVRTPLDATANALPLDRSRRPMGSRRLCRRDAVGRLNDAVGATTRHRTRTSQTLSAGMEGRVSQRPCLL
jgi:hypothetical protein